MFSSETNMRSLENFELIAISGGDGDPYHYTADDEDDNAYSSTPSTTMSPGSGSFSATLSRVASDAAAGLTTAIADCANGAAVGAMAGSRVGLLGAGSGAFVGCAISTGVGIIRDAPKNMTQKQAN
jgi:hypothetical protein